MKEDVKAKLKAKVVGDEELDNVAGGTTDQNMEILNALAKLDGNGVSSVLEKAGAASGAGKSGLAETYIGEGTMKLLKKHLGVTAMPIYDLNNIYSKDGQKISHADVMQMINAKIQFAEDAGFEIV